MNSLMHSPLHDRHEALGAKFAEFSGWQMPLEYAGVVAEHDAVRNAAGIFDVSHLGKVRVRGEGAAALLNTCLTNDLDRIGANHAQYTLCCDDDTGGIIDDLIVYRFDDDHVLCVPNAANSTRVAGFLRDAAPSRIAVTDEHADYAIVAVQGPRSAELLAELDITTNHEYMSFVPATVDSTALTVCRTGYTGEHGYELIVASDKAGVVWDALLSAGERYGVAPAGLGARDTLRTEMGYALHGNDISPQITPVEARLGWAVGWRKPTFWGREILMEHKAAGPDRLAWGLEVVGRGIPRDGMRVFLRGSSPDAAPLGHVTSGTFSPTRKIGIALALLHTGQGIAEQSDVEIDVRGRRLPAVVVRPPFVPSSVS